MIVSGKQADRLEILSKVRQEDVVITSYDLLRRDIDAYSKMKFGYQIIDEAQYIKNSSTLSSKAVKQINSGFRLALTGTPIENKLCELWSIFDYLMPGFLHDYRQFKEEYETPIVSFKDNDALVALRKIIHPFVLRRLKSDVLRDLPDKLEETVTARLTDEQSKLYRASLVNIKQNLLGKNGDELKSGAVQILAELMRLRQICCDPSLIYENYKGGSANRPLHRDRQTRDRRRPQDTHFLPVHEHALDHREAPRRRKDQIFQPCRPDPEGKAHENGRGVQQRRRACLLHLA